MAKRVITSTATTKHNVDQTGPPTPEEFNRFETLTKRLLSVPKQEMDAARETEKANRQQQD